MASDEEEVNFELMGQDEEVDIELADQQDEEREDDLEGEGFEADNEREDNDELEESSEKEEEEEEDVAEEDEAEDDDEEEDDEIGIKEVFSSGEDNSDESLDIQFGTLDIKEYQTRVESQPVVCNCYSFPDSDSALNYMRICYIDYNPYVNNLCMLDNLSRALNIIQNEHKNVKDPYRLCCADLFYRLRHEILFKATMFTLNLPTDKSDIPFTTLGLDSKKTPDFIEICESSINIYEISAVSNVERAMSSKGVESAGFESKYRDEIDQLIEKGNIVNYFVFIFDMNDPKNKPYIEVLNECNKRGKKINNIGLGAMNLMSTGLAQITCHFKSYLTPVSSLLFMEKIKIEKDHSNLAFIYEEGSNDFTHYYQEFTVSHQVYSRISKIWHRLLNIIDSCNLKDNENYKPVLAINSGRLEFMIDSSGLKLNTIKNIVENNNKYEFFKNLQLKVGKNIFSCLDSDTGFKFIERVKVQKETAESVEFTDCTTIADHEPIMFNKSCKYDSIDYYQGLIDFHFKEKYKNLYYDPDYENKIIDSMCKEDKLSVNYVSEGYSKHPLNKLIGNLETNDINIKELTQDCLIKLVEVNSFGDETPMKIKKMKNSFILPIGEFDRDSYKSLDYKDYDWMAKMYNEISKTDLYTARVLSIVMEPGYVMHENPKQPSKELSELLKMRADKSALMTKIYKDALKCIKLNEPTRNIMKVKVKDICIEPFKTDYLNISKELSSLSKAIKQKSDEEGVKQNIGLVRLPTKNKKSMLYNEFRSELRHFKDKIHQSTTEGVGLYNGVEGAVNEGNKFMDEISHLFTSYCGENPDFLIDNKTYGDCKLLNELKQKAINDYDSIIMDVKNSYLGHASAFVSRFAHSLLFYSQMPFNSDYVRVDNLGYGDVLLFVKGGKKIFNSKSSKFYRILYPVNEIVSNFIVDDVVGESSSKVYNINFKKYVLTPWNLLHESILHDSLSFYPRVVSFVVLNSDRNKPYRLQVRRTVFNVLLAFHNRRQTEVFLANLRYILLATLGDFTGISEIFPEFIGFNYDKFQSYVRCSLFLNYPEYFKKLMDVKKKKAPTPLDLVRTGFKNIFTRSEIKDIDDLTIMIYSTFLMTKGPYKRNVERAINLKSILNIHDLFNDVVGLHCNPKEQFEKLSITIQSNNTSGVECYSEYARRLFGNDFSFDPYYCSNLGVFADSYYNQYVGQDDMLTNWLKILNYNYDSMATSTGLRGDMSSPDDFWGKKGYFVVYKGISDNKEYMAEVKDLLEGDDNEDRKRKRLRLLNQSYRYKIQEPCRMLVFSAVDKTQWRGSREIYVMDEGTKLLQQPIEKYMGYLCQKLDNELISIPSDKRAQVIHHSIFEKDLPMQDVLTWYLTLDCTKWAPKSIFVKFALMALSMECLPSSFKTHFLNYLSKLYEKRVYFNIAEVEVLKKNTKYEGIVTNYLKYDEKIKGYYLEMPYSWMMGIFNYTSSFMHAFNQKYASYLIFKTSLISFGEETKLFMFAHSDDSGGRITASDRNLIKRGLILYEINLKACNHLLSKKKSVVSRLYFEILSVIYIFKQLLALLPKFLGGIRFLPTDKGPAQDMLQSYSKCIEVMIAGADFSIAYLIMKFYSAMVWRFYFNKAPTPRDYLKPVQFLGMPDAHPLIVLINGSDSDIIRIMHTSDCVGLKMQMALMGALNCMHSEEGPVRPPKFKIKIRNLAKGFEDNLVQFERVLEDWSVGNVNFQSTPFGCMSFFSKLNDPGFVGSLVNETPIRRISRSYFLRVGNSVLTSRGEMKLKTFYDIIDTVLVLGDDDVAEVVESIMGKDFIKNIRDDALNNKNVQMGLEVIKSVCSSTFKLLSYMEKLTLEGKSFKLANRTLKPSHVQIIKGGQSFSSLFDPAQLVSYIKEPKYRWALPSYKNIIKSEAELDKLLSYLNIDVNEIDCNTLLKLIRYHVTKNTKDIYMYSQIPSEIRTIKTYSGILTFLATNSIKGKEIDGLNLKLPGRLVDPGYNATELNDDLYYASTLMQIFLIFMKNDELIEIADSIRINAIPELKWNGVGTVQDLLVTISNMVHYSSESYLLHFQVNYLIGLMDTHNKEQNAKFLNMGSFYCFLKEQRSRVGWFGRGEIMFFVKGSIYIFELENDKIVSVESNRQGKMDRIEFSFIIDSLKTIGVEFYKSLSIKVKRTRGNEKVFGIDLSGDLYAGDVREMTSGVTFKNLTKIPIEVTDLEFSTIRHIKDSLYILKKPEESNIRDMKIYGLRFNKGDILHIIKDKFNPDDFSDYIISHSYSDFTDFITHEVLFMTGSEAYIGIEDLFNSFNSSKIFKVFKETSEKQLTKIPVTLENSNIPYNEGGLLRIIYEYDKMTSEGILKMPNRITPDILNVRSEYPQQFSIIFSEKMQEAYKDLYTPRERSEVKKEMLRISSSDDYDIVKKSMVKLMVYWGYSSLVNVLETYTFEKKKENYTIISLENMKVENTAWMETLFPQLMQALNSTMLTYKDIIKTFRGGLHIFENKLNVEEVIYSNMLSIANNIYMYKYLYTGIDLSHLEYLNLIHLLIHDEDFCINLEERLSKVPVFNSLSINMQNEKEFISAYNTLRVIWIKKRIVEYEFDFGKLLNRTPPSAPMITSLLFSLDPNFEYRPTVNYFGGYVDRLIVQMLKEDLHMSLGPNEYYIKQKICNYSDKQVPVIDGLHFNYPISDKVFEEENWEEIVIEASMADQDIETINELFKEIEIPLFKKTTTKLVKGKTANKYYFELNWVIDPYKEGREGLVDYIRQIGENVCILTNRINPSYLKLPNSCYRYNNLGRFTQHKMPFSIIYCLSSPTLSDQFWHEYIGPRFPASQINLDLVNWGYVVRSNKIRHVKELGLTVAELSKAGGFFAKKTDEEVKDLPSRSSNLAGPCGDALMDVEFVKIPTPDNATMTERKEIKMVNLRNKLNYIRMKNYESIEQEEKEERERSIMVKLAALEEEKNRRELFTQLNEKLLFLKKENKITESFYLKIRDRLTGQVFSGVEICMESFLKDVFIEMNLGRVMEDFKKGKMNLTPGEQQKIFNSPEHFGVCHGISDPGANPMRDQYLNAELNSIIPGLAKMLASGTLSISPKMTRVLKTQMKFWKNMANTSNFKSDNKKFLIILVTSIFNSSTPIGETDEHTVNDESWQNLINNVGELIAADPETDDDESDPSQTIGNSALNIFSQKISSRLLYKATGV
jgi:hypothetical protein